MVDAYPKLADPYVEMAGQMAATWFEESGPAPAYVAKTAAPIPQERLEKSARWALSAPDAVGSRLSGTMQRAVLDGARNTTLINVERTGMRWARDARADACAFCRMLATRTSALYRSQDTAATKVHDDCHCLPVEVPDPDSYELPGHAQQWEDEYLKARANAGTVNSKQILSAWRSSNRSIN